MKTASDPRSAPRTSRREVLRGALAGGGLVAGSALLPSCSKPLGHQTSGAPSPDTLPPPQDDALPAGLVRERFLVHGSHPLNLEMPRSAFGAGALTPIRRMYVRANLPLPSAEILNDRDSWVLSVEGVRRPGKLTLSELKRLGVTTVASVVQCSGNGRRFFPHRPSGSPWGVGAAAQVLFTGVSVRAVAEALGGVAEGLPFLTGTGGEPIPEELSERDVVIERSIPAAKGLADCLLAWEMNGEPIPLPYGGPLRLIVPGYYGINQVKYLSRLAFTAEESDAKAQRTSYRMRAVGEAASPEQPSMWAMNVKSWITAPLEEVPLQAGRLQVVGVALAGEKRVSSVEVSINGGESFSPAKFFGPDFGPFGWRQFVYAFDADPGEYVLASRARDEDGGLQPQERQENHRGYGNNSWRDHSVRIQVS